MIEELISRVFAARDAAHREHFRTKSYAEHMALGSFYEGVVGAVDALVECHQGQFGIVGEFQVQTRKTPDVIEYLADEAEWIGANREVICNDDPVLLNLLDGLTAIYMQTIYKLRNLS